MASGLRFMTLVVACFKVLQLHLRAVLRIRRPNSNRVSSYYKYDASLLDFKIRYFEPPGLDANEFIMNNILEYNDAYVL